LVPYLLVVLLVSNVALVNNGLWYQLTMCGQIVLYVVAMIGHVIPRLQRNAVFRIPLFFCMVNLSIVIAWYRFLTGQKQVVWTATRR
ncbi:MAG: hypothetical protein NTW07_01195, partial [candidate division Zixibacteria bacterium]|nr:hypothetical protein [candidate division Zixibacteria bacterium]